MQWTQVTETATAKPWPPPARESPARVSGAEQSPRCVDAALHSAGQQKYLGPSHGSQILPLPRQVTLSVALMQTDLRRSHLQNGDNVAELA